MFIGVAMTILFIKFKIEMKKLSGGEVEHIAKLANLTLSEKEVEIFSGQLSETISYIEKLNELQTKSVSPTSQTTGLKNVFREDEVESSFSLEHTLGNAKKIYKGYFVTKPVFD